MNTQYKFFNFRTCKLFTPSYLISLQGFASIPQSDHLFFGTEG